MSETNMDGSSVSSEGGKQNEPLQTISITIPEVTETTDFTQQISAINSRVDNLENKLDAINNSVNGLDSKLNKLDKLESSLIKFMDFITDKEQKNDNMISGFGKKLEELDTKTNNIILEQSNMSKGIRSDMSDMNIRINMIESSVSKVSQEQQTLSAQPIDIAEAVYTAVQTEVQAHGDRLHQRIDEMELRLGNAMDARVGNIEERFH